jgi:hypothetical protein
MGFVVDEVALWQVFLWVLWFFHQYHFAAAAYSLIHHPGDGQWTH